jgi:hypothetical protein
MLRPAEPWMGHQLFDSLLDDEVPRTSRTGDPLGSFSEKVRARASESTEILPGVQR